MTPEHVRDEFSSLVPSESLTIGQVIWDRLPDDLGTDRSPVLQAELERHWIKISTCLFAPNHTGRTMLQTVISTGSVQYQVRVFKDAQSK